MIAGNAVRIREHVRMFKFGDVYDLCDPGSGEVIGEAREKLSLGIKIARLLMSKRMLPVAIDLTVNGTTAPVATIRKGFTFWRARVEIRDATGTVLGILRAPVLSLFKYFDILSETGEKIGGVKGNLIGWNYSIEGAGGSRWARWRSNGRASRRRSSPRRTGTS